MYVLNDDVISSDLKLSYLTLSKQVKKALALMYVKNMVAF